MRTLIRRYLPTDAQTQTYISTHEKNNNEILIALIES